MCRERVLPTTGDVCPACRNYTFVGAPEESLPPVPRPEPAPGVDERLVRQRRQSSAVAVGAIIVVVAAVINPVGMMLGLGASSWVVLALLGGFALVLRAQRRG